MPVNHTKFEFIRILFRGSFRQSCNSILRCPSVSDGRLSYQFLSNGYIRRSVYAYLVLEKLEMKWSPEQISGWLRRTKPRQKTLRISPETIYKTLYFRSREALHHLNIQHLRRSHSLRHGRRHTRKGERGTINIVNGTPIHERSRNIDNRRSLGHWEGDLVSGTKNSHIATLVDRKSRYTIILRLRGKDSVSVNQALTDKFLSLPSELRKSLTWDRGMELARHLEFTVSTGVKVYFCDPQSPWQRGTNENTNGLIRQY